MPAPFRSPSRVFIIEDDPAVRDALSILIEGQGIEAVPFDDGADFLASVSPEAEDVVVLDLRLPGVDGFEVAATLEARASPCRLILISAERSRAFEAAVAKIRPDAAFRKPLRTASLLAAIGAL